MASWTHPTLGMGLYLFYPDDWQRIFYKNCTLHEISSHPNISIGAFYVTIGRYSYFSDEAQLTLISTFLVSSLTLKLKDSSSTTK